ncbi:MAG: ABC transporter ATP-binding protein [Candidatus Krumholzibacteriia bacterium]
MATPARELTRNTPPTAALAVAGLRKSYRRGFLGRRGEPAVADLSFTVAAGEIFALLGHNGAGKTTTIKAILDLVRPERGSITIGGRDARRPEARLQVGYLPEHPSFHENLTAAELLDFFGKLLGLDRTVRRRQVAECLERVGMAEHAARRLGRCSKGMRQRVGLAQALLGDPRLLILDEPQSGLDPVGRRLVRDLLLDLKREGRTVVFSSHIVPDVAAVADRVATLRQGRLVDLRDLRERPAATAYRVVVAAPADPDVAGELRRDPSCTLRHHDPHRWTLETVGAGPLAALLARCDQAGLAVHDVVTLASDLEDTVLADLVGDAQVREVPAC